MKKSILTIVAFMLFALAGFAQSGERVYIRQINYGTRDCEVVIYEKGNSKKVTLPNSLNKQEESIKEFAKIMEGYLSQNYKIVSSVVIGSWGTEYILEKQ